MSNEQILPPIPFTEHDRTVMRTEDVKAAKYIAGLASGIFVMGLCIYTTVLLVTVATAPLYAIR